MDLGRYEMHGPLAFVAILPLGLLCFKKIH